MEPRCPPQPRLSLKVKRRALSDTHGSALSHQGKDTRKHPFLNRRPVCARPKLGENESLCQCRGCGTDQQKTMSQAWFLCGDCNGPFWLPGVWFSKMDFVHFPLRLGKPHVAVYKLGLPARLWRTDGVGVVCVCETPWTELESSWDTQ